jgi:steroid delta-isomerase-like uncharacterized protein
MNGLGRWWMDAWNSHDPNVVAALYAEDATLETVDASGAIMKGLDAIRIFAESMDRWSSDSHTTLLSEFVGGDWFVLEFEENSTNTGELIPGVPATNKRYKVRGAVVGRLDTAGKITEERDYVDILHVFTQIGLLSAPGT